MKSKWGYETFKERNLFLLCWIAYFSTYLCRLNFSAIMPEISAKQLYTETQIAMISSCFFICYGIGQFINGILGDKFEPRKMVFIGLLISGLSNVILFSFHGFKIIIILWGINGFVQSMIWSPILRIAGDYYNESGRAKFGIDISTTVPLGTLASYGVCLVTMLIMPWNGVFLVCGLLVLIVSIIWYYGTGKTINDMPKVCLNKKTDEPEKSLPFSKLIGLFVSSGLLVLLLPIALHGALKDSVTQWVPTYMNQQFSTSTSISLILTMVLPIVNVTGAFLAHALNKKLKNEVATAMFFFMVSFVFLIILYTLGSKSLILTIICLALVTNSMFAVNVMTITMIPLHFSKYGRTSTLSGTLNSIAYIGCGLANMGTGYLLNKYNWNVTILLWGAMAVVAIILSFICMPLWNKFVKKI